MNNSQNSSNNSGAPGPKKYKNNKKRYYNKNKNKSKSASSDGQSSAPNSNGKKRPFNNRKKSSTVKLTGLDYITTKYLNLLDQHIQARRKYFENFDRANDQALQKLEYNYIESQKVFLAFKERLSAEDLALFESHFNKLKIDDTYSSNHNLDPLDNTIEVADEQIEDPHLLESQKNSNFTDDDEESHGSIDDYKKYKGIE